MQTAMPKQEFDQYENYTTLFDMDGNSTEQFTDYAADTLATNHMRNISSGSVASSSSSTIKPTALLKRNHPSLESYKGNPGVPPGFISLVTQTQTLFRRPAAQQTRRYNPMAVSGVSPVRTLNRRSTVRSDDEDNSEPEPPLRKGATEEERAAHKRRMNTIAARRSRHKRAQELTDLREIVGKLEKDCLKWKTRSNTLLGILVNSGVKVPVFDD